MTPLTVAVINDLEWLVKMPDEMARACGATEGSYVLLRAESGALKAEVVPPLAPETKNFIHKFCEKNKEALEELKRLGD